MTQLERSLAIDRSDFGRSNCAPALEGSLRFDMSQKELSGLFFSNPTRRRVVLGRVAEPIDSIKSRGVEPVLRASLAIDIVILVILQCQAPR